MSTHKDHLGDIGCLSVIGIVILLFVAWIVANCVWHNSEYALLPVSNPTVLKFHKGDLVKIRGSNQTGIVHDAYYYTGEVCVDYWYIFPIRQTQHSKAYYEVRLFTQQQIGIDTAAGAGHGFLGSHDIKHFTPTFSIIESFEEFELEKR